MLPEHIRACKTEDPAVSGAGKSVVWSGCIFPWCHNDPDVLHECSEARQYVGIRECIPADGQDSSQTRRVSG